jgi:DNA-binding PadR family transcriptional regulator
LATDDKGFLINAGPSMMVLVLLREQARYGYDIGKELERLSEGRLLFQPGTLYPILHKLEKKELIKGIWEHPEGERPRRIYALTEQGRDQVEKQIEEWLDFTRAVRIVIDGSGGPQPASFA